MCEAATGKVRVTLDGHHGMWGSIEAHVFSPNAKFLVTCSGDKTAKVWDLATGREMITLRGHSSWVTQAVFLPDGRLATADLDGGVRLWGEASRPGGR